MENFNTASAMSKTEKEIHFSRDQSEVRVKHNLVKVVEQIKDLIELLYNIKLFCQFKLLFEAQSINSHYTLVISIMSIFQLENSYYSGAQCSAENRIAHLGLAKVAQIRICNSRFVKVGEGKHKLTFSTLNKILELLNIILRIFSQRTIYLIDC